MSGPRAGGLKADPTAFVLRPNPANSGWCRFLEFRIASSARVGFLQVSLRSAKVNTVWRDRAESYEFAFGIKLAKVDIRTGLLHWKRLERLRVFDGA